MKTLQERISEAQCLQVGTNKTDMCEERVAKGRGTTSADCVGGWKQSTTDPPQE